MASKEGRGSLRLLMSSTTAEMKKETLIGHRSSSADKGFFIIILLF